jgi:hypothetical protein
MARATQPCARGCSASYATRTLSGSALALAAYHRELLGDQHLEYLTKAVLVAKKRDTAEWQRYHAVVEEAATKLEDRHDA